jgi:protein-arginine kinase activator protein McsA
MSEVLSSSPYKNALLATRKEPSNNKQSRKTLRCDRPPERQPVLTAVEEEKIKCPGCDDAYEEPITEDWVQCSGCKQWWHQDCSNYEGLGLFKCDVC